MSVVIPTYNRSRVVAEAVQSVLDQRFKDFELIVVDDGSSDDTAERLSTFSDPRLRYVRREVNRGVAAARNLGVALTTGSIIAFLDSDDLWMPDKLEIDVAFLDEHREVDAVFTDLERHDGSEKTASFMRQTSVFSRFLGDARYPDGIVLSRRDMFLCLLQEVPIKPTAFAIRRAAFAQIGGFDESWSSSEDWEFFLRLAQQGQFAYIDRPLVVLRISSDSLHRVDGERGRLATLKLFVRSLDEFAHDSQAVAALRRGIRDCTRHLCWHYLHHGRRADAFRAYLRAFRSTHDPGLLLRAAAIGLPNGVVERAKRLIGQRGSSSIESTPAERTDAVR